MKKFMSRLTCALVLFKDNFNKKTVRLGKTLHATPSKGINKNIESHGDFTELFFRI